MIEYEGSWVCGTCKPIFFQKVKEGVVTGGTFAYAGFWIRFLAKVIDGIIMQIVFVPIQFFAPANSEDPAVVMRYVFLAVGIQFVIRAAYQIFFVGKWGATVGKMALRLKVVRPDGNKVSYGRACGRYFAEILSGMILAIGYIIAAFDEQKRSMHDRICDTRVIRTNP